MNCWEFMQCPRLTYERCPAYPDHGTQCWRVDDTKCNHGRMAIVSAADKIVFCRKCAFYNTKGLSA